MKYNKQKLAQMFDEDYFENDLYLSKPLDIEILIQKIREMTKD